MLISFKTYLVKVNNQKRIITLHDSNYANDIIKREYKEISVANIKNRLFLPCQIPLTDGLKGDLLLLLDSGAAISLLLFIENDTTLLQLTQNTVSTKIGLGLGGYLNGYSMPINALNMGPIELNNIILQYLERDSLYRGSSFSRKNGLIGNQIMDRFNYFLDFEREKVYLKPNSKFDKAFRNDKSGIIILAAGLYLTEFYIAYIQKDSPALEAGLQPGDQILSVNGWPHSMLSIDRIYKSFSGKEGKKKRLKIKRGAKKLKFKIILTNPFIFSETVRN